MTLGCWMGNLSSHKVRVSARLGGKAGWCSVPEAQTRSTYSLRGPSVWSSYHSQSQNFLKCYRYDAFFPWAPASVAPWLMMLHALTSLIETVNKSASTLFASCAFELAADECLTACLASSISFNHFIWVDNASLCPHSYHCVSFMCYFCDIFIEKYIVQWRV